MYLTYPWLKAKGRKKFEENHEESAKSLVNHQHWLSNNEDIHGMMI